MDALPLEIWREISSHINCGSDWKAWIFTCREFAKHNTDAQVVRFANYNDTILKLYRDQIKENVGENTLNLIEVYTKIRERGIVLKTEDDLTWDIIISNPDIPWNFDYICGMSIILIEHITFGTKFDRDTSVASINPNITWEIYNDNEELFDWDAYQENKNVTWDIIIQNPERDWDYAVLSYNPNITWDIVRNNLRLGWDFHAMTYNPNITWKIIRENIDLGWDFYKLSSDPDISIEEMLTLDYGFTLELSPNITMDIVNANPNRKWNYDLLAQNPSIKFEQMRDNPLMEPYLVSYNNAITIKNIMDNPDYDWYYGGLLRFRTITRLFRKN